MKKSRFISVVFFTLLLNSPIFTQTSGILWITKFNPGSNDLNDPQIDKRVLATLDSLMQDENIEATFLGAADAIKWNLNGKNIHENVSEALNDAKRIGRARALRERYRRGNVGITHEPIAGVKVFWSKKNNQDSDTTLKELQKQNNIIKEELEALKSDLQGLKPEQHSSNGHNGKNGTNGNTKTIIKEDSSINWHLLGGLWSWQSGSNGSLVSPSVALSIIFGKTSFIIQGGVTPWHFSTSVGNQSESFIYAGLKHMSSDMFGVTAGAYRGWKFFTSTDNWSFKTTGVSTGIIFTYGRIELNPMLTFSSISSLENSAVWKIGSILGVNFKIN